MAEEIENQDLNLNTDGVVEGEQLSFVDDQYRFKLENFEGPLDLLLHLIKNAKLDIMSVKLADITEQYLEYMQDIESIDMDRASEFITVAATLLEIKSKHLLPVETEDDDEEEDSEMLLLQRLKEYELFKQTGARLRELREKKQRKLKLLSKIWCLTNFLMLLQTFLLGRKLEGRTRKSRRKLQKIDLRLLIKFFQ